MKCLKLWMIGMVAWTWLISTPMHAEEGNTVTETFDEIVVTATRTEKTLSTAPGSVSVISREDLDKRSINTLDEALNTTAGVFDDNKGKGLMGTTSSISMRGMSYDKRVLFLMDGILPLNDAYSGSVKYQTVPIEDVEKIEVVKGPFSSLYGGYAMAGVVNVQTKMPDKRELKLKTGYGSGWSRGDALDDLTKLYFSYGDKINENVRLLASYSRKDTNGYPTNLNVQSAKPPAGISGWEYTTDPQGNPRYLIGDTGDNTWWDDEITLKTGLDFSPTSKLKLFFVRSRYEYGYDDPHTYLKDTNGNEVWQYGKVNESSFLAGDGGTEQNMYGLTYETQWSSIQTKAGIGYLDRENSWYITRGSTASTTRDGGPGTLSETPSGGYNADLQFTMPLLHRHIVTFGSMYRSEWAHTEEHNLTNWTSRYSTTKLTYESKGTNDTFALFVQDEILLFDSLTAYLGLRQDWWRTSDGYANSVGASGYPKSYDSRSDDSLSPKGALVYKPFDVTTMRVSAGQAFRSPTVYDLYRTWTSSTGITYQANPDLKPETVTSWDAGVEQDLWKGMKVKATYFENYMKDLIYRLTVSSTLQKNINAGKAESKGVELEASQRFDNGLRLFANYTYTDAYLTENQAKPSTEGKKLIQVPENMFNLGATYEFGPFTASLIGRYVSKRYGNDDNSDVVDGVYTSYDPYFTADAKLSYKMTSFAEISFSASNIFDENYYGYYPGLGSSYFAELTLKY